MATKSAWPRAPVSVTVSGPATPTGATAQSFCLIDGPLVSNLVANASVRQVNEITAENLGSFHFHGNIDGYPISAIIPQPPDDRSAAMLLGRYQEERDDILIVRSQRVIAELLDTVFTVRDYIVLGVVVVALATAIVALLVFSLSLRLRKGERYTLERIGASRAQIRFLMATEISFVLLLSAVLTAVLVALTERYGMALMQGLLLG